MENLKITVVQCNQHWEDKKANFSHISSLLTDSSATDLIVLPEMFNTGFTMNPDFAEDENGDSIQYLKELAREKQTLICASLIFKSEVGITNRLVIVSESRIVEHYDKVHLFSLAKEDKTFDPGVEKKIVTIKGWKILLQVCYDLRFPVFSRYTSENPYDAVIYIANWPEKRREAWSTLLKARAIENQCYVVGCNRIGEDKNGLSYSGDSAVLDPLGEDVLKSTIHKEVVKQIELSVDQLVSVRSKLPFLEDMDEFTVKSKNYVDE